MGKIKEINEPYYRNNQRVKMTKGYTGTTKFDIPVYTADMFDYIGYFYKANRNAPKYDEKDKDYQYLYKRFGKASKYDCIFYLNQAKLYYQASKNGPFEVSMLSSYYCMLNLAKSLLSYRSNCVNEFVRDFQRHGINEGFTNAGDDFENIFIQYDIPDVDAQGHKSSNFGGVFTMLAKSLDSDFETKWQHDNLGKSIKTLLYNLPFVQSSYMNTYASSQNKIKELFVPLAAGASPYYFVSTGTKLLLKGEIDVGYLAAEGGKLSDDIKKTLSGEFDYDADGSFRSLNTAPKNNDDSINKKLKEFNAELRKNFVYIGGNHPVWFIKRTGLKNKDVLNISTITINMAVMHRLSEIARYKPEQLQHLMDSKESWLFREYMTAALDQFVDEMASEITGKDVMLAPW